MKKMMITVLAAFAVSGTAFAQTPEVAPAQPQAPSARPAAPTFEQIRERVVSMHQSRATIAQTALDCVKAATNHDAMRACHEKEREARREMHEHNRSKDGKKEHKMMKERERGENRKGHSEMERPPVPSAPAQRP